MAKQRRRFLGDLDAATDPQFKNHFVESLDLARILRNESDIIYGSKGVGKTALRRALTELNEKFFYATKTIDLDQISFAQVHASLSKLKDTTQTEVPTLARNTWRNILAIYCLEATAEQLSDENPLRAQIEEILDEEGFNGADSNNRLISQIERFLIRIAEAGLENSTPTPLGLNRRQRSVVNSFPSNPVVESLLMSCSKTIEESGKFVLICIDGFDSIVDHTPESRKAIFAGLISAIHSCSRDPLLTKAFCFKAFLPQELTDDAHAVVWDADKHVLNTGFLKWSDPDFQYLLKKRLSPYSKTKANQFLDVWHEYMPDKIRNDVHRIDEPSFGYILRHTLYRPRQLLTHLQKIFDKWDEMSNTFRVDPSFIPQVVAGTNYELANIVANQLEIKHPGLSGFMQSWHGAHNTMLVTEFQERLKRIFGCSTVQEVNSLFDDLFNFGIFGIALKAEASKGVQQSRFRFGFVGDRIRRNIHTAVEKNDLLALSPMFHEYCGCIASEYGAVIPIDG